MAVDRDELVAILHETQRALAVLPIDHPGRHDLEMSLWDLRLQRSRLANTKVAASGADLTAAQVAVDRVRRLLDEAGYVRSDRPYVRRIQ
jgi:hypothetical protein